jgi:DNA ligase 1
MTDIADGEVAYVQGSAAQPYELKNVGGVYSCSCPAWRNAGGGIDTRTCKHLKGYRGEQVELARIGAAGTGGGAAIARPRAAKRTTTTDGNEDANESGDGAAPVLLAHKWEPEVDLTGWWISEKLDGVRAYWDGQQFVSRLGNAFYAPSWFTEGFPDHPLDGELWVGRKEFQSTVSIVRRMDGGDQWKKLRYLVFDAPHLKKPFEKRVEFVEGFIASEAVPYMDAVEHMRCTGIEHVKTELSRVEKLGGEGLMMRKPGSLYEVGRSHTLLKVKSFFDAEARVVGHEPGKGKHKGRLGALVLQMPDGTRFNVGSGFTDAQREAPLAIGSLVTYRYQELTNDGVPRFPTFVGEAIDKT